MGQALFFPQQAAAASATAPAADSAKDGSRPKSKTSRSLAEPAPPPEKPAAPTMPSDSPKKSQSPAPAPPPRPLAAVTPPLPQERSSALAPLQASTSPDKPKSSSGTSLNPKAAPFYIKKDWLRPWGGASGAVGEQPKPPVPSRASPAPGERQQGTARSVHTPPPPPSPLAEIAPQSGDSDKGKPTSAVPVFKAPFSFTPPERPQDPVQARFQFGKNQEFNRFMASLQSQSTVRKSIDAEERSIKSTTETLKSVSPPKSVSQTSASPVSSVKTSATGAVPAASVEKQSPNKTSVKHASVQTAKPAAVPSPPANDQNSFQLLITSAAGAQGPQGSQAGAAQTFSMSVAQKGAGCLVSSAERERRVKRLRKRQSELAAARHGKVLSGGETKQDAQAAENAKQRPDNSPDLRIQGASPAFSTPPTRPLPQPPALFTFSSNVRKPESKPASNVPKGFGAPAHSQLSSTGPGQPKFTFSFGTSSSPKPLKLGQTPSSLSLPPIQEIRSGGLGWSSTTINNTATTDTNSSPSADPTHTPQRVRLSPVTPLKAKRKVHLKGVAPVATAQHKQENDEETREQGSPASTTSPPKPAAHSPGSAPPPTSPVTPDPPAKPKKKIRFKIPFDLGKSETNRGTANRVEQKEKEKKEKKEKSKEVIPTLPASPPSPECPPRPSGGWPPFTAQQSCSRKARCRHQSGTELPRNVTRWLNVKPNYLCEPPWVTTATLAASVALILRQDGTYNQQ